MVRPGSRISVTVTLSAVKFPLLLTETVQKAVAPVWDKGVFFTWRMANLGDTARSNRLE